MSPAGILNGTKLVIDRARTPQVGNVVVAYIDNQPVVKRLDRQLNGGWMLSSDNPSTLRSRASRRSKSLVW
ncbi:S24 family peptidase [Pseudomonas sp. W2-17]|uniref:S24 family peptidase n=1 Tax=Pseudomonas sp. W2-17 TaxID=3058039 RepID=UPI0034E09612